MSVKILKKGSTQGWAISTNNTLILSDTPMEFIKEPAGDRESFFLKHNDMYVNSHYLNVLGMHDDGLAFVIPDETYDKKSGKIYVKGSINRLVSGSNVLILGPMKDAADWTIVNVPRIPTPIILPSIPVTTVTAPVSAGNLKAKTINILKKGSSQGWAIVPGTKFMKLSDNPTEFEKEPGRTDSFFLKYNGQYVHYNSNDYLMMHSAQKKHAFIFSSNNILAVRQNDPHFVSIRQGIGGQLLGLTTTTDDKWTMVDVVDVPKIPTPIEPVAGVASRPVAVGDQTGNTLSLTPAQHVANEVYDELAGGVYSAVKIYNRTTLATRPNSIFTWQPNKSQPFSGIFKIRTPVQANLGVTSTSYKEEKERLSAKYVADIVFPIIQYGRVIRNDYWVVFFNGPLQFPDNAIKDTSPVTSVISPSPVDDAAAGQPNGPGPDGSTRPNIGDGAVVGETELTPVWTPVSDGTAAGNQPNGADVTQPNGPDVTQPNGQPNALKPALPDTDLAWKPYNAPAPVPVPVPVPVPDPTTNTATDTETGGKGIKEQLIKIIDDLLIILGIYTKQTVGDMSSSSKLILLAVTVFLVFVGFVLFIKPQRRRRRRRYRRRRRDYGID